MYVYPCQFLETLSELSGTTHGERALVCLLKLCRPWWPCWHAALEAYKHAGSVAEEALANVRTIASLGGEAYMANAYAENLKQAQKTAIKGGLLTGAGEARADSKSGSPTWN